MLVEIRLASDIKKFMYVRNVSKNMCEALYVSYFHLVEVLQCLNSVYMMLYGEARVRLEQIFAQTIVLFSAYRM